jgi:hypothetical protein
MLCHEFESAFQQFGDVDPPAEAVAHLDQCAACRAMVEDLELICSSAKSLAVEPQDAPERVWLSLRSRLREEGIIRQPQPVADRDWVAEIFAMLRRPVLAGAYAALAVAAVGLVWLQSPSQEIQDQTPQVASAASDISLSLANMETATISHLHPANSEADASLTRSIAVVDKFIALCEKTVREHPRDTDAREYLNGAYQQKSELLAAAVQRSWPGE